ncbi:hypothetical protein M0813_16288 [Anaeramoeba flamelloides]|uniref:BTB domain-containing protein n=1 Tax=Anaeramoeba flamelloides TaxID=1746091 RepID=A0ABQ8Z019_9EUKA|nr:hypothetical protein M0813_16288 [Anaeramoeba flamelloides]
MNWLVLGNKSLFLENEFSKIPKTPSKFKDEAIDWIASGEGMTYVNKPNGELVNLQQQTNLKNLEKIVKICAGYSHYLALGISGKVYSWGNSSSLGALGHDQSVDLREPKEIKALTDKKIKNIYCGNYFSLALSENGDLYSFGNNQNGDLGTGNRTSVKNPTCFHKKVTDVYCGLSWNTFLKYEDGHFTAHGHNGSGSCGAGTQNTGMTSPQIVEFLCDNSEILNITSGLSHSLALNRNGELYGCGARETGMDQRSNKFIKHDKFNDIPVKNIACADNRSLILTKEGEVFVFNNSFQKMNYKMEDNYSHVFCDKSIGYYFKIALRGIIVDLDKLLKSGYGFDLEICGEKLHKFWLSVRLNSEYNKEMNDFFSKFTNQEFKTFLNWCYKGQGSKRTEELINVFEKYQIDPQTKTIENDLLKLYKDEESKDFNLLIKEDDNEEEYDDEDDNDDDDDFEELPVHKFILIARCGLFRDFFSNIKNETNSIKDFSGKSIDSIEIFLKFLYTDKIELTADHDPELVVEELSDAIEYYQLNDHCIFNYELKKIKKQFNLI